MPALKPFTTNNLMSARLEVRQCYGFRQHEEPTVPTFQPRHHRRCALQGPIPGGLLGQLANLPGSALRAVACGIRVTPVKNKYILLQLVPDYQ